MQAMERAEEFPITREHLSPPVVQATPEKPPLAAVVEPVEDSGIQRLFLTFNRKTLLEIDLTESKVLIGRSELCDVSIESRFVSKHHALLVRTDNALHLLDLNSTNGTFVNSRRIQSKVLRHDDIISVGNHGIKLICPAYRARPVVEELDLAETSTLKTLADIRPPTYDDGEDAVPAETGEGER
jgi:pSer/pThr/pTyr-binding forkhead associated (FHA) protein